MNHGILKRVIALCIAGCVMALTLAACGDSEENNEGTGTVQDMSQDAAREDEDGTIEAAENGENVTADSSGNDVRVAHASSSGNGGNGFAIPVFKPGEEPDSDEESQPGEEPKPGAGTQQPQQPSTRNPTEHTHNWVTQTVHHDAKGHYESRVTGTEEVRVSHTPAYENARCFTCEVSFGIFDYWGSDDSLIWELVAKHAKETGHDSSLFKIDVIFEDAYETRDIIEDVWVVDTAAWDETVTICNICGAKQ